MSQLIMEFPLEREAVTLYADHMAVELGNGVRLTTSCPVWIKGINGAKLQLILEVEGGPDGDKEKLRESP